MVNLHFRKKHMLKKRERKKKIVCATLIMKFWRGHYVRVFYEEDIQQYRNSKMKIYSLLLGKF